MADTVLSAEARSGLRRRPSLPAASDCAASQPTLSNAWPFSGKPVRPNAQRGVLALRLLLTILLTGGAKCAPLPCPLQ